MSERARFLTIDDLTHLPKPVWMIEGLFEANSLVMLAGPPGSYKSFLALDWMLSMATHRKWQGRPTIPAKVLYVLGEGKASLLKRIQAWTTYNDVRASELDQLRENFRVTFDVPQMALKASVDNMLAGLEEVDFRPSIVVIDTFARSFVGQDENSQQDTGLWIESAERLRDQGYTVIFVHHTAKNTEFGHRYRGSSTILGAVDTAFTLYTENNKRKIILTCSKQKDHEESQPMYFSPFAIPGQDKTDDCCVLIPQVLIDDRFTEQGQKADILVNQLIEDATFESDRARARELARQCGMTESAAQTRISRKRKDVDD